jgi:hypothetical protein
MTKKHENLQERTVSGGDASTFALLASMADTTWRMFTPPALLVAGGLWIDLHYHTKPWITVLAAIMGLTGSILLIRSQLRRIQ